MQLKPFLLDAWLDQFEHHIEFNLAASTGPAWTVKRHPRPRRRRNASPLPEPQHSNYGRPAGADRLREAIAEMQHVPVRRGPDRDRASEALVALMWLAAETRRERNHPAPWIHYVLSAPESLRLETRFYRVARTASASTPTRSSVSPTRRPNSSWSIARTIRRARPSATAKWKLCTTSPPSARIQLVSDEVYHPSTTEGRRNRRRACRTPP